MKKNDFKFGTYRHFKGQTYRAYSIVNFAEGEELVPLVLYKNIDGKTFARTLDNFTQIIERDGKKFRRFEKI